MNHIQVDYFSW